MKLIGEKREKHYTDFLIDYFPKDIVTYVEPFGGTFNMSTYLEKRPEVLVYNDINKYTYDIHADFIYHKDYKEIIKQFDNTDTIFYLDPPYYQKEHLYDLKRGDKDFHIELRDILKTIKGKFFISYEDCRFIRELYKDFQIDKYDGDIFYLRNEIIIHTK